MRLKVYRGRSVAEAMTAIRSELGPDALILSTRRVSDGMEVTAALEPADEPAAVALRPASHLPAASDGLMALAYHGVPEPLARRLDAACLRTALESTIAFHPLSLAAGTPPLLFTGPPGAGKTLTTARLATRLVMAGIAPLVITADARRAGATEQLAAFTRLLGVNLLVASNPVMLARALARRQNGAPVLIDCPGSDVFDRADSEELRGLAASVNGTMALVLPAGLDPNEAADLAAAHRHAGATLLIATRLDLARRLGGVLCAADAGGLALAEAGIGPGAADGLVPMTPALLAERLLRTPHARPLGRPEGPA